MSWRIYFRLSLLSPSTSHLLPATPRPPPPPRPRPSSSLQDVASGDDCLQLCKDQYEDAGNDDDKCEWYTYYPENDGRCLLFDRCTEQVPEGCDGCVSGERLCELEDPGNAVCDVNKNSLYSKKNNFHTVK